MRYVDVHVQLVASTEIARERINDMEETFMGEARFSGIGRIYAVASLPTEKEDMPIRSVAHFVLVAKEARRESTKHAVSVVYGPRRLQWGKAEKLSGESVEHLLSLVDVFPCLQDITNVLEQRDAAAIYEAMRLVASDTMFGTSIEAKRLARQTQDALSRLCLMASTRSSIIQRRDVIHMDRIMEFACFAIEREFGSYLAKCQPLVSLPSKGMPLEAHARRTCAAIAV